MGRELQTPDNLNPEPVPRPFAHRVGSYIRWVLRPWSPIPWVNNPGLGHGALTRPVPPPFAHRVGSYKGSRGTRRSPVPWANNLGLGQRPFGQTRATAIRPQSGLLQGF